MSRRGKTMGDFCSEVFGWATENWFIIFLVAGFVGVGPCSELFHDEKPKAAVEAPAEPENRFKDW